MSQDQNVTDKDSLGVQDEWDCPDLDDFSIEIAESLREDAGRVPGGRFIYAALSVNAFMRTACELGIGNPEDFLESIMNRLAGQFTEKRLDQVTAYIRGSGDIPRNDPARAYIDLVRRICDDRDMELPEDDTLSRALAFGAGSEVAAGIRPAGKKRDYKHKSGLEFLDSYCAHMMTEFARYEEVKKKAAMRGLLDQRFLQ